VLEWTTEATLASGEPIAYRGVSLLEHDGDHVVSFRTYYDSRLLSGRQEAPRGIDEQPDRGEAPTGTGAPSDKLETRGEAVEAREEGPSIDDEPPDLQPGAPL
jgi:hypothetical protein